MERLKIVIVGHVDHGKSTLIGRLFYDTDSLPESKIKEIKEVCEALGKEIEFGYVLDYLEEERKQGVTIDTTQSFFKTQKREYAIIDAPGHVEFLKNMITGASQAEAAILIVDAKEGIKEQTRRHAYILSMLGLKQVIVVINKMDLVDYSKERFQEVKKELLEFLKTISIEPKYIIPISAKNGDFIAKKSENLSWYDGPTVLEALDSFEKIKELDEKPFRLPVQDVYNFDKRVIVGRIASGVISKGDEIKIYPSGEVTKIKSVEKYGREIDKASAGESIGLTTEDKVFVDRGDIISKKDEKQPIVTKEINAHIFWMDKEPYKEGERLLFKCATQEVMCEMKIKRVIDSATLETLDKKIIENRNVADVVIKTEKPVVVESFNEIPPLGRFVLQRQDTCAGGIITGDGCDNNSN
ncbi:MAG: GTP-binding protein [Nanoarchaeota archaeon]|nr:GTP-binding protein [Nanoarchaeota archaeon]